MGRIYETIRRVQGGATSWERAMTKQWLMCGGIVAIEDVALPGAGCSRFSAMQRSDGIPSEIPSGTRSEGLAFEGRNIRPSAELHPCLTTPK